MHSGISQVVLALTVFEDNLVAGGWDRSLGAVVRWDGSVWQSMGSGTREYVNAFAIHNGNLIAAGDYPNSLGAGTNHIARWDGSDWRAMGTGVNSSMTSLTVYDGDIIAGGTFRTAGGKTVNQIARWGLE